MSETIAPGTLIAGRFRVEGLLGEGGSASTYRARDRVRDEPVALKVLRHPSLAAAMETELDLLGRVAHPHLLRIHDCGSSPHGAWYSSALVEGRPLDALDGWAALGPALTDVVDALRYLHALGVRHGDVKPANVIVDRAGRATLIDLGCAAPLGRASSVVSGSPGMMAPEVLAGRPAGASADLFSLGRTIEQLEAIRGPAPDAWRGAARRCVEPELADRPSSADEVLELVGAADRARAQPPPEAPRLVGRDAERARFRAILEAWRERRSGPRALLLDGPPGSGRTRLLEAFKRAAQRAGHEVVEASPRQADPLGALLGVPAPGLEAVLDAAAGLPARVLVLDDAAQLSADARRGLAALIGALEPDHPALLLAVSEPLPGPAVDAMHLGPLSADSVAAWARDRIDPEQLDALTRRAGGHPATVRWLLARGLDARDEDALEGLPAERLDDLARVVAAGSLPVEGVRPEALAALLDGGWVRRDGDRARPSREALEVALERLAPARRRAIHASLAEDAEHEADRLRHRVEAGETPELEGVTPGTDARWARAARALVRSEARALRLTGADWLTIQGDSAVARGALAQLVDEDPTDLGARRRLGACLLRLEDTDAALDALGPVLASDDALERARATDVACRVHIKRGAFAEAAALADAALAHPSLDTVAAPAIRAALLEDRGVARSYLGHADAAADLREAREALGFGQPRDRVRVTSYLAIDAFRRGRLEEAREGYAAALALVERHALDDQLAHAALNLGTVAHQTGDYGAAHAAYRRAHRIARALGQRATVATLELNDAQLYADVGAFDRALAAAERARALADEHGFALLAGSSAEVRARVELARGDLEACREALSDAEAIFEGAGAAREVDELWPIASELALREGRAPAPPPAGDAEDVALRVRTIDAERAGDVDRLEAAVRDAEARGLSAHAAAAHGALARVWRERGAGALEARHRRSARERWERCAAGLPEGLRAVFWRHPDRAGLEEEAPTPVGGRERQLERLLALNRTLGSSLEVDAVLHQAMDAAVELTGAERGFLVLRGEGGELEVPVARNLDRERVGRSHLKFSRSIAERAIEIGEPVITVDARSDARFREHESVHAMKLRSVIAVPIPSPEGVVGALYLDNRFARGRFAELDASTLMAFADQVAIALTNARLHEALRHRTEELERERERVLALSRGQAEEIERLSARLAEQREALARRYDYGVLVARSPAMKRVLSTLDRVIGTPLTVLVQGESGVGKELVARAIHFNGPGREGRFVTVNCAALPDALLESELFGHVRGAFTGADRDREGLMVAASGGTLFLDEIGETSLAMQAKLLRALEQREVRPVGGTETIPVDFRLVCATNRDLSEEARASRFREDLYYRIGVVEVRVPPLRERAEDIPELVRQIVRASADELDRDPPAIPGEVMHLLLRRRWPGNVRQLANALRAALVMSDGPALSEDAFALASAPEPPARSRRERDARERVRIEEALDATDWNVTRAAKRAGVSRATMYRKMKRYGLR